MITFIGKHEATEVYKLRNHQKKIFSHNAKIVCIEWLLHHQPSVYGFSIGLDLYKKIKKLIHNSFFKKYILYYLQLWQNIMNSAFVSRMKCEWKWNYYRVLVPYILYNSFFILMTIALFAIFRKAFSHFVILTHFSINFVALSIKF